MAKRTLLLFLALATLTGLALFFSPTGSGVFANDGDRQELTYHNLGSLLDAVVASYEQGRQSEDQAAEQGEINQGNSIAVYIILNSNTASVVDFLNDNGASVRNVSENYIEAYVPVSLLGAASQQTGVIRVRQITPPSSDYGPITSQGVALHKADIWHTAGYTGQGVKVGILDRFDKWQELQDKGELPSPTSVRCYSDIGQLSNDFDQCAQRRGSRSQHGTAAAEVITDVAPGVSLYLSNPTGWADHLETIRWMAAQGVQVISNSRGSNNFIGPGDGTTPIPVSWYNSIDEAVSSGIIWFNSAGNDATGVRWYGNYSDSNQDNVHEWGGTGGTDNDQTIYMEKDAETDIDLRWEDQWGGATRDLDILIYSRGARSTPLTAPVATGGQDRQNGGPGDWPVEQLEFTAPADGWYEIEVKLISGTAPSWLQLGVDNDDIELEYHFPHHTIAAPADSANPGMMAVGATHHWETDTIAVYSNQGPTIAGINTQERIKPEITGVSCTSSDAYSGRFCGTSGAAPHVAGLAALVLQANTSLTPQQTANYLKTNAAPRLEASPNNTVPNNVWGYGFAEMPTPPDCVDNLTADGTTSGTWAAGCQSAETGRGYARYYSFTTTESKDVTVVLDSTVDTYMYLRSGGKTGAITAQNDDHGTLVSTTTACANSTGLDNTDSCITITGLAAGSYTIEATTYATATTGNFTLTVSGLGSTGGGGTPPPADTCTDTITADGATNGTWAAGCQSEVSGRGYARYYSFTTTEAKDVTVVLDSTVDTYMYLRSGTKTGAITAQNDDHGTLVGTTTACASSTGLDNTDSCITITGLAAGSYTIEATTYATATAGNFTLTVSGLGSTGGGGTPPPADTCVDSITADGTTSGTWAAGCQSAETGRGYARYYSFTTTESKDVTVVLDSTVDTYMYLRSGTKTGAITAQNDDHGTLVGTTTACANSTGLDNTDSCITITGLAAGSYTIEATTYATATTGSFTLTVSGLSSTGGGGTPPPTDTCTDSITADGTTGGTWAAGCQSAETGRGYARYYSFTTTEAKDVTITLSSTVDTYLYLRSGDKTGAITAQNDDHGTLVSTTTACANSTGLDNTDSCITLTGLAAGSYTIEATTYATATTGSFTLTVSGLGTAPAAACTVNQTLTPGQSCSGQDFTVAVKSNGNLSLEFTGTAAPPSGLSLTRSGNNWTVNSLP